MGKFSTFAFLARISSHSRSAQFTDRNDSSWRWADLDSSSCRCFLVRLMGGTRAAPLVADRSFCSSTRRLFVSCGHQTPSLLGGHRPAYHAALPPDAAENASSKRPSSTALVSVYRPCSPLNRQSTARIQLESTSSYCSTEVTKSSLPEIIC